MQFLEKPSKIRKIPEVSKLVTTEKRRKYLVSDTNHHRTIFLLKIY